MKQPYAEDAARAATIRALYTIPELARLARTTRFRMARVLETHGVEFIRSGRSLLVPISEIERAVPRLMEAIVSVATIEERARRAAEETKKRAVRK